MKAVIFGYGKVARDLHVPACRSLPELEVVGICEPLAGQAALASREFPGCFVSGDAADVLNRTAPDLVIIATPPDSHRELCLSALEAGCHVFCEKPFMPGVDEADEVLSAARQAKRSVVVNNEYRFLDIYRKVKERLSAGEYGRPFYIQFWQQMNHPPEREDNWRGKMSEYTLYEFGTHPLDLICYFFDSLPISITTSIPKSSGDYRSDVVVQSVLRFPGDRLATLSLNRISHALPRYLEARIDCDKASLRISFGGIASAEVQWSGLLGRPIGRLSFVKGGEARAEAGGRSTLLVRTKSEQRPLATARCLKQILDADKEGGTTLESARRARDLLRIVAAGYESARTGQTIAL